MLERLEQRNEKIQEVEAQKEAIQQRIDGSNGEQELQTLQGLNEELKVLTDQKIELITQTIKALDLYLHLDDQLIQKQVDNAVIKNQLALIKHELNLKRGLLFQKNNYLTQLKQELVGLERDLQDQNLLLLTGLETLDEKKQQI
jgi:hypothetical protein